MYRLHLTDADGQPVAYPFSAPLESDPLARRPVVILHAQPLTFRQRREIHEGHLCCFSGREVFLLPGETAKVEVWAVANPNHRRRYEIAPLVGEPVTLTGQGDWEGQEYAAEVIRRHPWHELWDFGNEVEPIQIVQFAEWVPGERQGEAGKEHLRQIIKAATGADCFVAVGANLRIAEAIPVERHKPDKATIIRPVRNRRREVGRRS